jgi:integrase/recombinase XerC
MPIENFLTTNGYSQATIDQYRRVLRDLIARYDEPAAISAMDLLAWLDGHTCWGSNMRWMAFSACRSFLRWQYGADHPALKLKIQRTDSGPQRTISPEQAAKLIGLLANNSDLIAIRDLAIVELLLDTGLRESEICRLETGRVNLVEKNLSVLCKGNQWGYGIFSDATADAIRDWLFERRSVAVRGEKALFVSIKGSTRGRAITPSGLRVIARRWGELIGCPVSPHDFRRGFATIATRAKAPSRLVQMAGRWEHIEMVERYTRDLEMEDFREYLPVDFLRDI